MWTLHYMKVENPGNPNLRWCEEGKNKLNNNSRKSLCSRMEEGELSSGLEDKAMELIHSIKEMTDERNEQKYSCILAAILKDKNKIQAWNGGAKQVSNVSIRKGQAGRSMWSGSCLGLLTMLQARQGYIVRLPQKQMKIPRPTFYIDIKLL